MYRLQQCLAGDLPGFLKMLSLCLLLIHTPASLAQNDIGATEATFKFVAASLQCTGRLDQELGIDESEGQEYIVLLRGTYEEFKRGLHADRSVNLYDNKHHRLSVMNICHHWNWAAQRQFIWPANSVVAKRSGGVMC